MVGDANFLEDEFARANPQNLAFAANAVDWLAQDEALIAIRSKDRRPPPLVFASDVSRIALKWGNLLGVPILFALLGLFRVLGGLVGLDAGIRPGYFGSAKGNVAQGFMLQANVRVFVEHCHETT